MTIYQLLKAINNSGMPAHNLPTPPVSIQALYVDEPRLLLTIDGSLVGTLEIKDELVVGLIPDAKALYGHVAGVMAILAAER